MRMEALRADGVTKVYANGGTEVRAVDGVDIALQGGEVTLIMGPSGSGKTTLLFLLGGLLRLTAGRIVVSGKDLTLLRERAMPAARLENFGFVFQDFNLLANLTARENVQVPMELAGVAPAKSRNRAGTLLTGLGLGERLDYLPEKLSGGEKQRVSIARALANTPRVLLADEPTANLDSKLGKDVAALFQHVARSTGAAVLMVSHDARIVDVADRLFLMEDGRLQTMT
ncbi:MAG TPA: ABC transporter ATP-binding protein [Thermoplasmata archaeon]|nr:ABC transporter ATP-binding protein [Thermoplasmata archaeon]HLA46365.1 ABC transporter ATP-binding protein [Thermoplasmata archaeon]